MHYCVKSDVFLFVSCYTADISGFIALLSGSPDILYFSLKPCTSTAQYAGDFLVLVSATHGSLVDFSGEIGFITVSFMKPEAFYNRHICLSKLIQ